VFLKVFEKAIGWQIAFKKPKVLDKSKFILLVDRIHSDMFWFIICRTSSLTRLSLVNIVIKVIFMII